MLNTLKTTWVTSTRSTTVAVFFLAMLFASFLSQSLVIRVAEAVCTEASGVWTEPNKVTGQPPIPCCPDGKLCNPIRFGNLTDFFLEIVNVVIQYGALLIVLFIVFAGFKFVTAQGNSEKVSDARKMLTWIVVGAFVLLGVYVIRAAICGTIGQLGVDVKC